MTAMMRALSIAVVLTLCLIFPASARAAPSGHIAIERGPIELSRSGGSYKGGFAIDNTADTPLVLSRVAARSDADDPRVPRTVIVEPDGAMPLTIAPHTRRRVNITWTPEPTTRQRQLLGHVVVTSSDESSGEVAVGLRAQMPTPLGVVTDHVVSTLLLLPLLGALAAIALYLRGISTRSMRAAAITITVIQSALALWMWHAFDGSVTRADGNDGLQFVEHAAWLSRAGAEYFVGADGENVAVIALIAIVSAVGLVATSPPARDAVAFDALYLIAQASGIGALAAQDALLWLSCIATLTLSVGFALAHFGDATAPASVRRALGSLVPGFAAIAGALVILHLHADKTLLASGTAVARSWSLPELARVSFVLKSGTVFGLPFVKVAYALGVAGALAYAGAFPVQSWLSGALSSAPTALGALLVVTVPTVGLHALARITMTLPEAARWAATPLLALGLASALASALSAAAQRDPGRALGLAVAAQTGLAVAALASSTQQGVMAFFVLIPARAAGCALLALAWGHLRDRLRVRDGRAIRGLGADAPMLAVALTLGGLSAMAAPLTGCGWATMATLLAAVPRGFGAAAGVALVWATLAAALGRLTLRMVSGSLPDALRDSRELEPHGGRVPDLRGRQLAAIALLALMVGAAGVYPGMLFSAAWGAARDLGPALNPKGPGEISLADAFQAQAR
jgi:NADH-quinone oxidoreductase subunit M